MHADAVLGDRYRLSRLIASGGMGEVWQAHDAVLDREVAVKLLSAGESDPSALERFRREAVAMAALQHPNTVLVLDIGTHHRWTYIVMELLSGPTLAQLVASRGPLPEAEVAGLGAQVAAGLEAAHRAGIVHRDIKPGNLMMGASGELKVVDFGVARLSQAAASALTATNTIIWSALYLSPEQAAGSPADERSDLYALGCVLMTLATGRPPFESEHPIGALHQHVRVDPPLLRTRRPGASAALEALIGELLAKDPDDRPASAAEVAVRLKNIEMSVPDAPAGLESHESEVTARMTGSAALMPVAGSARAEPRHAHVSEPQPARGRARAPWVAAGVLVSSALLAAMALTQGADPAGDARTSVADSPAASSSASPLPSPSTTPSATPDRSETTSPTPPPAPAPAPAPASTRSAVGRDSTPPVTTSDDKPARGKSDEKKATTAADAKAKERPTQAGKK
ncbi:MAG TPA: protein kinase [Arachnia sp.]|nr:protein kinase [Arachnia sp.]